MCRWQVCESRDAGGREEADKSTDFVCPTCDSGASALDSYTMRMMLAMALVAATSFTWFVAGRII
jgi:hypothetical protein